MTTYTLTMNGASVTYLASQLTGVVVNGGGGSDTATLVTSDTYVGAGGTVTWSWTGAGNVPHSIQSLGSPSFASSAIQTGDGSTYHVTFSTPGTYQYDCAVHGTMMSGTIVVR